MQPPKENATPQRKGGWVYVSLLVLDGERRLKPAQVGPNCLLFNQPPHLRSSRVEIILTNGDHEQRQFATVLPHGENATRIPIQLMPPHGGLMAR